MLLDGDIEWGGGAHYAVRLRTVDEQIPNAPTPNRSSTMNKMRRDLSRRSALRSKQSM